MKKRSLLLGMLLGFLVCLATGSLFPPLTFGFWKLAFTRDVAFSVVGLDATVSDEFAECLAIEHTPFREASYRLLYLVGTNAAKCHALVGLRGLHAECYPEYLARLESSKDYVMDRWMDTGESLPVGQIAKNIRNYREDVMLEYQREFREWRNHRIEEKEKQFMSPSATRPNATRP